MSDNRFISPIAWALVGFLVCILVVVIPIQADHHDAYCIAYDSTTGECVQEMTVDELVKEVQK